MERRGSIEVHPKANASAALLMMRRCSDDSFAQYSYQDLMNMMVKASSSQSASAPAPQSSEDDLMSSTSFVHLQDSLAHIDYETDEDSTCSDCSSLGEDHFLDRYDDDDDNLEDDSVSSFDFAFDDSTITSFSSSASKRPPGRHVRFAATTRVRVHGLTLEATADNACHWSLDWAHAPQEVHEPVRFDDDTDDTAVLGRRPLRRFSLHQREKRLAAVTGWSLDRVYQQEEEALLRQIEQMVRLRCDSVDKSSDNNNKSSSSSSSSARPQVATRLERHD